MMPAISDFLAGIFVGGIVGAVLASVGCGVWAWRAMCPFK